MVTLVVNSMTWGSVAGEVGALSKQLRSVK